MPAPTPYLHLPGTARDALSFWADVFGGTATLNSNADLGAPGPPDAIAHGVLSGPVDLFAADAGEGQEPLQAKGLMLALLGTAPPPELHRWFAGLSEGGTVVDDLQQRPWGAWDGQVVDRFGVHWLVGYEA